MPSLTIEALAFKRALAAVKPAIPSRTTIPILGCVRFETANGVLKVDACDLARSIMVDVPAEGEAAWCLDYAKLATFASVLPDGGLVRVDGDTLVTLRCGKLSAKIGALPVVDWPHFAHPKTGATISVGCKDFKEVLTRIAGACWGDNKRQVLNGIHLGALHQGIRLEATDGHLMARQTIPSAKIEGEPDAILPRETPQALAGLPDGDLTITLSDGLVSFACGDVSVSSKLIEGQYPSLDAATRNYKGDRGRPTEFDSATLHAAVKAASGTMIWDSERVLLSVDESGGTVTGATKGGEAITIPLDCTPGDPFEVTAHPAYIVDLLAAMKRETVLLSHSANVICAMEEGDAFEGIVMGIRDTHAIRRAA